MKGEFIGRQIRVKELLDALTTINKAGNEYIDLRLIVRGEDEHDTVILMFDNEIKKTIKTTPLPDRKANDDEIDELFK